MKKISLAIIIVGIVASVVIYKLYNKPHRDPKNEESIPVSAIDLFRSFEEDETKANALYLDKVLEITGNITEISANQNLTPIIVLETENTFFGVRCTMADKEIKVHVGETILVKGICTGYLSDVIITDASIMKSKN